MRKLLIGLPNSRHLCLTILKATAAGPFTCFIQIARACRLAYLTLGLKHRRMALQAAMFIVSWKVSGLFVHGRPGMQVDLGTVNHSESRCMGFFIHHSRSRLVRLGHSLCMANRLEAVRPFFSSLASESPVMGHLNAHAMGAAYICITVVGQEQNTVRYSCTLRNSNSINLRWRQTWENSVRGFYQKIAACA
jgi:hypothetical protein